MTQLIRVEHPLDGKGIFRSDYSIEDKKEASKLYERHNPRYDYNPVTKEEFVQGMLNPWDEGLNFTKSYHCAYKSIEQLREWIIPEEFKCLFEVGFQVLLLEVKKCKFGNYQAIYRKKDIISQTDISSLFIIKDKT